MKKYLSVFICMLVILSLLTACGDQSKSNLVEENKVETAKIKIVATTFPQYDWMRQIIDENNQNIELNLLLDKGIDLHSFQPTVDDIIKISESQLFVYVGGESDAWIEDVLDTKINYDMVIINLLDVLGDKVKQEEIIEGMEHDEDEEEEADEHVWLSLKNARFICNVLYDEISKLDPENTLIYQENMAEYMSKLEELDQKYQEGISKASVKTLLFGDRFPFRYMVDDYGLDYYAAFSGCSAETEASFKTIAFLSEKMDILDLNHIMVIETSDQSIADTVVQNTNKKNQNIIVLNSMQSVKDSDISAGVTYLSIMEDNLEALQLALD